MSCRTSGHCNTSSRNPRRESIVPCRCGLSAVLQTHTASRLREAPCGARLVLGLADHKPAGAGDKDCAPQVVTKDEV